MADIFMLAKRVSQELQSVSGTQNYGYMASVQLNIFVCSHFGFRCALRGAGHPLSVLTSKLHLKVL